MRCAADFSTAGSGGVVLVAEWYSIRKLCARGYRWGIAATDMGCAMPGCPGPSVAVVGRSDSLGDREGGCGCLWWWEYDG